MRLFSKKSNAQIMADSVTKTLKKDLKISLTEIGKEFVRELSNLEGEINGDQIICHVLMNKIAYLMSTRDPFYTHIATQYAGIVNQILSDMKDPSPVELLHSTECIFPHLIGFTDGSFDECAKYADQYFKHQSHSKELTKRD